MFHVPLTRNVSPRLQPRPFRKVLSAHSLTPFRLSPDLGTQGELIYASKVKCIKADPISDDRVSSIMASLEA
jgi:hypothetical protein